MEEEIWLPLPNYGRYFISNLGRVMAKYKRKGVKDRILKQPLNGNGYPQVTLSMNGKPKTYVVSRLVLSTFDKPQPRNIDCRHLDGNKLNSHLSNLAWGTRKENEADKIKHGTIAVGKKLPQSKCSEDDVKKIRNLYSTGEIGTVRLGKMFGISWHTVYCIVRRKTWKHLTD